MDKSKPIIISLGGSLVVPDGGVDTVYLSDFNKFIRNKVSEGWRFFIVVGGGALARHYIDVGQKIAGNLTDWDLDWLGIHATHLNAHLIRTIFRDIAHPRIINNYEKKIRDLDEPLVIAAGGKPGWSTDFDAVMLARDYGAKILINMSNITTVFNKDPRKHPEAIPLHRLTWTELKKLVGDKWSPGLNVPFDPTATKQAEELGLKVFIVGKSLINLQKILLGDDFEGTIVSS